MSTVCGWLSLFRCMRESPKKAVCPRIHPNHRPFDAIIIWKGKEGAKESKGGVAYDYILKPADAAPRPSSPPKEKPLTADEITKKLLKAEERRQSVEQQKLDFIAKEKIKAQEVIAKSQEEEEKFSLAAQAKLRRSLEITKENREQQIKALQDKLRDHERKIEEVRKNKMNLEETGTPCK